MGVQWRREVMYLVDEVALAHHVQPRTLREALLERLAHVELRGHRALLAAEARGVDDEEHRGGQVRQAGERQPLHLVAFLRRAVQQAPGRQRGTRGT
jgi:hypothetical protein